MRTKISWLLLSIVLTGGTAFGEIVIYKKTQKTRLVGQGVDISVPSTGYLLLDATTLNGYTLTVYRVRGDKFFTKSRFEQGLRFYSVTGPNERTHTVWVGNSLTNKPTEFVDATEFGLGVDALLPISATNSVRLPKTINGTLGGIVIPSGQAGYAQFGTGVASFSQKDTRLANDQGETTDAALARLRAALLASGYREVGE